MDNISVRILDLSKQLGDVVGNARLNRTSLQGQNRLTEVSLLEQILIRPGYLFCTLLRSAQRFRIISDIRLRAAADMVRFFPDPPAAGLLALPGGRHGAWSELTLRRRHPPRLV
jgi:hypothetical protein